MSEQPLTQTALLERMALGEHTRQQFKRTFNNPDALAAELAAFANSGDGTLLIGVDDDGTITGLSAAGIRHVSGIPRALGEWPQIELISEVSGNQFTACVQRPNLAQDGGIEQVADPVTDPVTDLVVRLLQTLAAGPLAPSEIQQRLGLKHRPTFRANYLRPALERHWIEPTLPDKPNSRLQQYRLTDKCRSVLK